MGSVCVWGSDSGEGDEVVGEVTDWRFWGDDDDREAEA